MPAGTGGAIASLFVRLGVQDTGASRAVSNLRQEMVKTQAAAGDMGRTTGAVSAQLNQADRGVKSLSTSSAGAARNMQQMQLITSALNPQLGALAGAAQLGAIALGGIAAVSLAKVGSELISLGASAERMEQSFISVWGSTQGGAEATLATMRRVSRGTIADTDLMLAANRAYTLGVAKSADELGTLLEIATLKGRRMGLSTTQAFNDIVTGLGRASPLILDNLGIVIDAAEANELFAKSIGKTADELTEAERKQALVNVVVEQGKEELRNSGPVISDTQERLDRLETAWANFRTEAGKTIVASGTFDGVLNLVEALGASTEEELAKSAKSFEDYVLSSQDQAKQLQRAFNDVYGTLAGPAIFEQTKEPQLNLEQWYELRLQVMYANAGMEDSYEHMMQLDGSVKNTADTMYELTGETRNTAEELANLEYERMRQLAAETAAATVEIRQLGIETKIALDDLDKRLSGIGQAGVRRIAGAVAQGLLTEEAGRQMAQDYLNGAQSVFASLQGEGNDLIDAEFQVSALENELESRIPKAVSKTAKSARETWENEMRGLVEGVIQPSFAGDPTATLDALGLHIDTADEPARRLASVMAEGLKSEWVQTFRDNGLLKDEDIVSDEAVKGAAARLLRLHQISPLPELIDKDTAIKRIEEIVDARNRTKALVDDILRDPRVTGLGLTSDEVAGILGDPEAAASSQAESIVSGITDKMSNVAITEPLAASIKADFDANSESMLGPVIDRVGDFINTRLKKAIEANVDVVNWLVGATLDALEAQAEAEA